MARVLMIDDELFFREFVADVLRKAKHEVVLANDGREGLEAFGSGEFQVVILDVVMPQMDGLAVLSKIRHADPGVPVIMLSAHEDQRMVLQALRRGAFDYQRKPLSAQELKLTVGRAIKHYDLVSSQQKKVQHLSRLEEGAKQLSVLIAQDFQTQDLEAQYEILEHTVQMVSQALNCDRVSLMLHNAETGVLKMAVSIGFSKSMIKKESKPAKESVVGYVLESGEPVLVEDVDEDERFNASEYASQYKTSSFIIAPLRLGDKIIGTINANDKRTGAAFNEEDLLILRTVSYQISALLMNALTTSALRRDRERLRVLTEFQRILIHYLEPEDMLQDLLRKCQEMMNVISCTVFLKDDFSDELHLRAGLNGDKIIKRKQVIHMGESLTGWVAEHGKILVVNSPESDKRFISEVEWPGKGTIRNILIAPLNITGNTIGVLRLLNKKKASFTIEDANLLRDIADSLSIAIRNMWLYEQLNQSVEEIISTNRALQLANDELALKAKELEAMKKMLK